MLLRPGGIDADAIARVLGAPLATARCRARRARRERWLRITRRARPHNWSRTTRCAPSSRNWKDATSASPCSRGVPSRPKVSTASGSRAAQDAQRYARALYANLRALDDANADVILVEAVPQDPAWAAIQDRLERATTGVDDDSD